MDLRTSDHGQDGVSTRSLSRRVIATDRRDCRCACERWETLIVDLSALLGGHYYHRHDIQIMAVGGWCGVRSEYPTVVGTVRLC